MINKLTRIKSITNVDIVEIDGDKVMLNMEKGKYFAVTGVGNTIMDLIKVNITVGEIIDTLLQEYDVDKKICEEETIKFLESIERAKLIEVENN